MKTKVVVYALLSVLSCAPAWAADGQEALCDSPSVIFCDNFEARATGSADLARHTWKNRGWENQSGHQVTQNSISAFSGSKGFTVIYPEGANTGFGFLLGYFATATDAPVSTPNVYIRWYEKWSTNFVYSQISNKNIKVGEISGNDVHLFRHEGPGGLSLMTVVGGITPSWWTAGSGPNAADTYHLFQQTNATVFQLGQWYCLEAHVRTNSSGSTANGTVEAWVNGNQVMSYTGLVIQRQDLIPATNREYSHLWIDGYWNCSGGATQGPGNACTPANAQSTHPLQYRYVDNIVASTQPIGCIGGTPPPPVQDTSPPNAPTNLNVTELWNDLKQLVATIWTWIGPASVEAAVPNDKLTLSWENAQPGVAYELRWQSFAHPEWIALGLVSSNQLTLVVPLNPPIQCVAGTDCYVCADARAKRLSDGVTGPWLSETPGGKACNQFAVGPIVLPPPPVPDPIPDQDPEIIGPAIVTMSGDKVFIACDLARYTRAKTTGTGTKRTITCLK